MRVAFSRAPAPLRRSTDVPASPFAPRLADRPARTATQTDSIWSGPALALAPLGYAVVMEVGAEHGGPAAGLGADGKPDFWIGGGDQPKSPLHVAFAAKKRQEVDAFHRAALAAGGKDNGGPGIRAHYHPNYYGAFILDADGNNIEAVCHAPA